jgi:hypothetical protein
MIDDHSTDEPVNFFLVLVYQPVETFYPGFFISDEEDYFLVFFVHAALTVFELFDSGIPRGFNMK